MDSSQRDESDVLCSRSAQGGHLLAVRSVQFRNRATRQPAKDGELPPVVNHVKENCKPQEVADRKLVAGEVPELAIEIGRSELADALDGLGVDAFVAGGERFNRSWPLDAVRAQAS